MMKCKTYVFKLTSGQFAKAPLTTRMEAGMHRWMCRHCRAFTANDAALDGILQAYRDKLQEPGPKA